MGTCFLALAYGTYPSFSSLTSLLDFDWSSGITIGSIGGSISIMVCLEPKELASSPLIAVVRSDVAVEDANDCWDTDLASAHAEVEV